MLNPHDRRLLSESLRPPESYVLDSAIGTTFSLDLYSLLTAPLAFTIFDMAREEGHGFPNSLALLTAMANYADRINLFCQAGQITVPAAHHRLYTELEKSIIQVNTPDPAGIFHPKIWLLRYTAPDAPAEPVRYRLLCLSRNLTLDRSWDTILVLDGLLTKRTEQTNRHLAAFIAALPTMATHPLPEARQAQIAQMQQEIPRVQFDLPDGFHSLKFWTPGVGRASFPLSGSHDRMLIMSPFLAAGTLQRLTRAGTGHILISRLEELQRIAPAHLAQFAQVYAMLPDVDAETGVQDVHLPPDQGATAESDSEPESQDTTDNTLVGLHAKLYLAESGGEARVWCGSANATAAAFQHNVELLVELRGSVQHFGIDALLRPAAHEEEITLHDLLSPFEITADSTAIPIDEKQQTADHLVEEARRILARAGLRARVVPDDDREHFHVQLVQPADVLLEIPEGVTVRCWPISLAGETFATPLALDCTPLVAFGPLSFEALTAFFAFVATATHEGYQSTCRFVLNLPLDNAPIDRRERMLRALIRNSDDFVRYLMMMLVGSRTNVDRVVEGVMGLMDDVDGADRTAAHPHGSMQRRTARGLPLLEELVRALATSPETLDQIALVVNDMCQTSEGQRMLPEGFEAIWKPIWETRERLRTHE